jgi:hypothetical protein
MYIKTARLGNILVLSSLETPFSNNGRMSAAKVIKLFE